MNTVQDTFREVQAALESDADTVLGESRLARSRLLRITGGALFAWAVSTFLPSSAWAHCPTGDNHPCEGHPLCGGYPTTGCENREAYCCSDQNNTCYSNCNPGPNNPTCDHSYDLNCWHTCDQGSGTSAATVTTTSPA